MPKGMRKAFTTRLRLNRTAFLERKSLQNIAIYVTVKNELFMSCILYVEEWGNPLFRITIYFFQALKLLIYIHIFLHVLLLELGNTKTDIPCF
jgi:hypothetical protein